MSQNAFSRRIRAVSGTSKNMGVVGWSASPCRSSERKPATSWMCSSVWRQTTRPYGASSCAGSKNARSTRIRSAASPARCSSRQLGIDPDSAAAGRDAQKAQEVGLPTADLEDVATAEFVALDERRDELRRIRLETPRERLRLLVARAVVVPRRVEGRVREEPACGTELQRDRTTRVPDRGLPRRQQDSRCGQGPSAPGSA